MDLEFYEENQSEINSLIASLPDKIPFSQQVEIAKQVEENFNAQAKFLERMHEIISLIDEDERIKTPRMTEEVLEHRLKVLGIAFQVIDERDD